MTRRRRGCFAAWRLSISAADTALDQRVLGTSKVGQPRPRIGPTFAGDTLLFERQNQEQLFRELKERPVDRFL